MSACASSVSSASADANLSNSASDSDPSSLHGARWSASSITPACSCHDSACPLNCFTVNTAAFLSGMLNAGLSFGYVRLHRLLHPIHVFDLALHSIRDQIALQLPVRGEHSVFNRKWFLPQMKSPHLLVVRQLRVDCVQSGLRLFRMDVAGDDRRKIAPAISKYNALLST